MRVIADVGDPSYYAKRAVELIRNADVRDSEGNSLLPDRVYSLEMAISILALAIAEIKLKEVTRVGQAIEFLNGRKPIQNTSGTEGF